MLKSIRSRMTYGNVIATMALLIALGGTSYAALRITGRQVVDSSLTGRDIKNDSLTGANIKNNSLTSADVKDSSLLARDFKSGQLPAGPQGPLGRRACTDPKGRLAKRG